MIIKKSTDYDMELVKAFNRNLGAENNRPKAIKALELLHQASDLLDGTEFQKVADKTLEAIIVMAEVGKEESSASKELEEEVDDDIEKQKKD